MRESAPREPMLLGEASGALQAVIRVVDRGGMPVAGAEVYWVDDATAEALQRAVTPEASTLPERIMAGGERGESDSEGRLRITVVGRRLHVYARRVDLAGYSHFDVVDENETTLVVTVAVGDTLRVRLVDAAGAPIASAPLAAQFSHEVEGGTNTQVRLSPLGETNRDGWLVSPGWRALCQALALHTPGAEQGLLVGPGYAGVSASSFAWVPVQAPDQLILIAPSPAHVQLQLCAANGAPVAWSGLRLSIAGEDGVRRSSAVSLDGRAECRLVRGRHYEWQCAGRMHVFGTGSVSLDLHQDLLRLVCPDIVSCIGRFSAAEAVDGIVLEFLSKGRGAVSMPLTVASDRTFVVQLGRYEVDGPLVFVRDQDKALIQVPPMVSQIVDLGVVTLGTPVFGIVRVVDQLGAPLPSAVVAPCGTHDVRSVARVTKRANGEFEVVAAVSDDALTLQCLAAGHATEFVDLPRRGTLTVTLAPVGEHRVLVVVPQGLDPGALWVRLRRRKVPPNGDWQVADCWAPARQARGAVAATFPDVRRGVYEAEIMSACPISTLAISEIELAGDTEPVVEATGLRQIRALVQVAGVHSSRVPRSYWVATGSHAFASPHQEVLCLRELPLGETTWTVAGTERQVILAGPDLIPRVVSLDDATVSVSIEARAGTGLPGVQGKHSVLSAQSDYFAAQRPVHVYLPGNDEMKRSFVQIERLPHANDWLWPCDYTIAHNDGIPRLVRWQASGSWEKGTW